MESVCIKVDGYLTSFLPFFLSEKLIRFDFPMLQTFIVGLIILFPLLIYIIKKELTNVERDLPSAWNQNVVIDFETRRIEIDENKFTFKDLNGILSQEYETFLFPTYYKIWLEFEDSRRVKFLALKDAQQYTILLKQFHDAGIPVN